MAKVLAIYGATPESWLAFNLNRAFWDQWSWVCSRVLAARHNYMYYLMHTEMMIDGLAGLFTHLRRDRDGLVLGHAGWVSASLWVTGMGARMAFVFAAYHGLGPAIGRFSAAHHITSKDAWAAALVMMDSKAAERDD